MYAYTKDPQGGYYGSIRGERIVAHTREQFLRLAHQAEQRFQQRQELARVVGLRNPRLPR
jgi:hypothetical protein